MTLSKREYLKMWYGFDCMCSHCKVSLPPPSPQARAPSPPLRPPLFTEHSRFLLPEYKSLLAEDSRMVPSSSAAVLYTVTLGVPCAIRGADRQRYSISVLAFRFARMGIGYRCTHWKR
jgi:hypothetical protein